MSSKIVAQRAIGEVWPQRVFGIVVKLWFSVAAIGHWIFLSYILLAFYPLVLQHGMEALKDSHLPSGFVEGDTLGNVTSIVHVLLAAIIIGGGPLQLIPAIRSKAPTFHRWLGRSYLLVAVFSAVGGLYMTWTRSPIGDLVSQLGISGDAVLIIVFAAMTIYHAMGGRLVEHRRWAMRLFLAASAVWFFRVGLMAWTVLTGGIGINWETFTGPFLYALGFSQYLLPLAMLEWYFYCQRKATAGALIAFSTTLIVLTAVMSLGIIAATMGMWLPQIRN